MTNCLFCQEEFQTRAVDRDGDVLVVPDAYPVTEGHLLLVPVPHRHDFFGMSAAERKSIDILLFRHRDRILQGDSTVTGFNVGMNCGLSAGQTVMHAHIHLIPRRDGDVPDPRGGVRGCVPEKMRY